MQDTVNFKRIAEICKIQAVIKNLITELARVSNCGDPEYTDGVGKDYGLKPAPSKKSASI